MPGLKRLLQFCGRIPKYKRMIGTGSLAGWVFLRASKKARERGSQSWHVHPRVLPFSLDVSLRGTSDFLVFNQIFMQEEYAPLRRLHEVSFILDLGANVGYSSAYLLSAFPNATVMAVEPDERNVAICRNTLAPFGSRAKVIQGAAWSRRTTLSLSRGSFMDGREWATQVKAPAGDVAGTVEAWDIAGLMELANRDQNRYPEG